MRTASCPASPSRRSAIARRASPRSWAKAAPRARRSTRRTASTARSGGIEDAAGNILFAGASGDNNAIHINDEFAQDTVYLQQLLYWGVWVKPSGYAIQVVELLAGSVLLSEVDLTTAS